MSSVHSRTLIVLSALAALHVGVGGCNSILDNKPGQLDDGTGEITTAQPGTNPPVEIVDDTNDGEPVLPAPDGARCPAGRHACNGVCVADDDPVYGCGDASCAPCKVRHATATCIAGACAVATCDKGFGDCNRDPSDGCEADLSLAASCGGCGKACAATSPVCAPAGGSFACQSGCPATAALRCGQECVSPLSSVNHCGGCNRKCPDVDQATTQCTAGVCTFTCKAGYHACGAKCVVATDPQACGAACAVCPTPANATATCEANACRFTCKAGFGDCNRVATDGCEAALSSDPMNCGACGKVCPGGLCANGVCAYKPAADAGADAAP